MYEVQTSPDGSDRFELNCEADFLVALEVEIFDQRRQGQSDLDQFNFDIKTSIVALDSVFEQKFSSLVRRKNLWLVESENFRKWGNEGIFQLEIRNHKSLILRIDFGDYRLVGDEILNWIFEARPSDLKEAIF